MGGQTLHYATFKLGLLSPLHAGSWRVGMVAQTHRFVPGHLFSYALAAIYGGHLGGQPTDYGHALQTVLARVRFAPAFLGVNGCLLYPQQDRITIEQRYVRGNNHVTLQPDSRAAQEKALFEVEYLTATAADGAQCGQPTELLGGAWFVDDDLDGIPWQNWLGQLILGGEGKIGYGRVRLLNWNKAATSFHGLGQVTGQGISLTVGDRLPGPALSGVSQVPQQPWLGRLYDKQQGFGRRLSPAAFVAMDGICQQDTVFLPYAGEVGLGCWVPQ